MSRKTITKQTAGAERALLEYMNRKDYRPMPQRELLHRTHVTPQSPRAIAQHPKLRTYETLTRANTQIQTEQGYPVARSTPAP